MLPWIFLGTIAGYISSKLVKEQGEGIFLDIALGLAGTIYGGFVFIWLGAAGVTVFHRYHMFVDLVAVVAVLVVYHEMFGRRVPELLAE